jgi:hypothetical protein
VGILAPKFKYSRKKRRQSQASFDELLQRDAVLQMSRMVHAEDSRKHFFDTEFQQYF